MQPVDRLHCALLAVQFFKNGAALPATVIALEEGNIVTQVKTADKDGYTAVQVGYKVCREGKITKPELGHLKKAGAPAMKHLREFKVRGQGRGQRSWGPRISRLRRQGQGPAGRRHTVNAHHGAALRTQVKDAAGYEPGQQLSVADMFKEGDFVDVAGTTIGKGFQGEFALASAGTLHAPRP